MKLSIIFLLMFLQSFSYGQNACFISIESIESEFVGIFNSETKCDEYILKSYFTVEKFRIQITLYNPSINKEICLYLSTSEPNYPQGIVINSLRCSLYMNEDKVNQNEASSLISNFVLDSACNMLNFSEKVATSGESFSTKEGEVWRYLPLGSNCFITYNLYFNARIFLDNYFAYIPITSFNDLQNNCSLLTVMAMNYLRDGNQFIGFIPISIPMKTSCDEASFNNLFSLQLEAHFGSEMPETGFIFPNSIIRDNVDLLLSDLPVIIR